ncbi:hypothetical protein ETAA8_22480 [Anatilimnocola aggregata]|uniref:Transposase DDE domain-containing protein n=1 Tax=Anatilimnocola aggregata TaxID=2528021 RepID=A0A517YA99_9BACT|nr:hypothetical protein ETAA8_22480 [Anatilimnocola aggregata]
MNWNSSRCRKPPEQKAAVYANRRRTRGERGKQLQRLRSEKMERTFAHVCETGGARRTWLTGIDKLRKRYLIAAAAHNLSVLMRVLFKMGTPRGLQQFANDLAAVVSPLYFACLLMAVLATACSHLRNSLRSPFKNLARPPRSLPLSTENQAYFNGLLVHCSRPSCAKGSMKATVCTSAWTTRRRSGLWSRSTMRSTSFVVTPPRRLVRSSSSPRSPNQARCSNV